MRVVPLGTGFRLLDEFGERATVWLSIDTPKGAGPVTVATTSGLAVASIPEDTGPLSWCQSLLGLILPCCVGDSERNWPWYKLDCDTCPPRETTCTHIRAVMETVPCMRAGTHIDVCRRMSAWPTQNVGGTVSNVPNGARCAVCLDPVNDSTASRCHTCTHRFHGTCLEEWLEADTKVRCPICRTAWPISVEWQPLWGLTGSPIRKLLAAG